MPSDFAAVLTAVLGFAQTRHQTRELQVLRAWLDSWPGIRWTAVAMHAEHQVLGLERRPDGWIATFTYTGPTQLPPAAPSGLGIARSPGQAVRFAAWQVVRRRP